MQVLPSDIKPLNHRGGRGPRTAILLIFYLFNALFFCGPREYFWYLYFLSLGYSYVSKQLWKGSRVEMSEIETLELLPTSSSRHREVHSFLPRRHDTFPSNTGAGGGETHIKDIVSVCLQGFCFLLVRLMSTCLNSLDKVFQSGKTSGRFLSEMECFRHS